MTTKRRLATRNLKLLSTFFVALGLTACGGCGEDDPQPAASNNGTVVIEDDMGNPVETDAGPENNGAPDPDMGPREPIPSGVFVSMEPARETYSTGQRLLPIVDTFDAFGDPHEFDVVITVEPADAAMAVEDRYELLREGTVRFTACTLVDGLEGAPVCGWDEVVVDDAPPTITLTSPTPGAQLDASANPMIDVTGTVTDTFGEPRAFVNGVEVDLDENGAFATQLTPRWGINTVQVEATDGFHPTTSEAVADVLWAADYVVPGQPPVSFAQAIVLRLGQLFVDDRVRVGTAPDGTFVTKDLADILELVVRNIDLSAQIPDPVFDSNELFLRVTQVSIGKPLVQLDITDDGLEVFIQVSDLIAFTEGDITLDNTQLSLDGQINGAISALVEIDVDKASPSDPIEVTVSGLAVSIDALNPAFTAPEVNAIFALAQSLLRTTVEDLLVDTLETAFVDQLPAILIDVLTALDDVLAGQTFDLDTGLGQPITLTIDGGVEAVDTAWRHHLDASLALDASASNSGIHPESRGYSRFWPNAGEPSFFDSGRIQFGIPLALVNSLLHALWDAGLLDADITDIVPVNAQRAELAAKLPPVVRPPVRGEPFGLVIELGQVEIETELVGRIDRYGVSLSTGIDLGLDNGALSVTIGTEPQIETWLISASEGTPILDAEALKDVIERQVWPEFTAALAGGLSIPLPAPDLSGLGGIAPALANLMLTFEQVLPLAVRDGWLVIDATLEGRTPVNP